MKQFELQKPISQLFNALKRRYLHVNYFQIGCSKQLNKDHNFRKINFFDVIALERLLRKCADSQKLNNLKEA